jgi:hypothetical protein
LSRTSLVTTMIEDEEGFDVEKAALKRSGSEASRKWPRPSKERGWPDGLPISTVKVEEPKEESDETPDTTTVE